MIVVNFLRDIFSTEIMYNINHWSYSSQNANYSLFIGIWGFLVLTVYYVRTASIPWIVPLVTNLSEIWIKLQIKMSSVNWRLFCSCLQWKGRHCASTTSRSTVHYFTVERRFRRIRCAKGQLRIRFGLSLLCIRGWLMKITAIWSVIWCKYYISKPSRR